MLNHGFRKAAVGSLFVVMWCGLAFSARAATIEVEAFDYGWYRDDGTHFPDNQIALCGRDGDGTLNPLFHSFFAFDLSDLPSEPVASAVLQLGLSLYVSPDPSEAFTVWDVSTPVDELVAGGSGLVGIYEDLGTGEIYGHGSAAPDQVGTLVEITLSPQAIADLNAAGGSFAVGMSLDQPFNHPDEFAELVRWNGITRRLVIETIPEPATASLLLLGAALCRRRRAA